MFLIVGAVYAIPRLAMERQQVEQNGAVPKTPAGPVLSIAGTIASADAIANMITVNTTEADSQYVVMVGEQTSITKITFPSNVSDLPSGSSFTPTTTGGSFADLVVGKQVFVRSSREIKKGETIADTTEIQLLP